MRYKRVVATLFELLEAGSIDPIVPRTYPLRETAKANAFVERGGVVGTVVLVAPALEETRSP